MSEESKTVSSGRGKVLDYMWIEKYRSFKNKEFHFDKEYIYSYDPENNILTRKRNEGYIKNFFGKNISVSAIVGKNGSGKTSLLSAIMEIFDGTQNEDLFFICAFKNGDVRVFKEKHLFKFSFEEESEELSLDIGNPPYFPLTWDISCIYYTQALDWSQYSKGKVNITYLSNGRLLRDCEKPNTLNPCHKFFINEFNKQLVFLDDLDNANLGYSIQEAVNFKKPEYVTVAPMYYDHDRIVDDMVSYLEATATYEEKIDLYETFKDAKNFDEFKSESGSSFIEKKFYEGEDRKKVTKFFNRIFSFFTSGNPKDYNSFEECFELYYSGTIFYALCSSFGNRKNSKYSYYLLIKCFIKTIGKDHFNKKEDKWNNLIKLINSIKNEREYKTPRRRDMIDKLYDFMQGFDFNFFLCGVNETYKFDKRDAFSFPVQYNEKSSEKEYPLKIDFKFFFEIYKEISEYFPIFEFSWNLSSGEICRLELYSRLYDEIKKKSIKKQNVLLLLDEADMLLHPAWQQRFVHDITKVFPLLFKGKYVQVIIATHSPIMLSDIPKQNTLFLKDDNTEEPKETFAANIYSLFKESFFLDDGMIGYFAEEKLKELADDIDKMKGNSDSTSIKQRIEMIGDKFVQGHFRELYYEKIGENDIIEAKKAQIADLQKDVDELEKKNNSKRKD